MVLPAPPFSTLMAMVFTRATSLDRSCCSSGHNHDSWSPCAYCGGPPRRECHRSRCEGSIPHRRGGRRSEEHTSELQSLMRNSYAVFCLKKKNVQDTSKQHRIKLHSQHHQSNT